MRDQEITVAAAACWILEAILFIGCQSTHNVPPRISFTKLPDFGPGNASQLDPIKGTVQGAKHGQKVVLYAKSGDWWVQPLSQEPFTEIQNDFSWEGRTHPGSDYAALLVNPSYLPRLRMPGLPEAGGSVLAIATVQGQTAPALLEKSVTFAGYEWRIQGTENSSGGTRNFYSPDNVWIDRDRLLHFKIAGTPGNWTSAEAHLQRSLGYGTYRFVIRDLSRLELAAVFTMMTWANEDSAHEMDIEVSKWGETFTRNAQFVIQPYHVPANTVQFELPAGPVTFMLRWVPGRATFKAFRGATANWDQPAIREHVFTSGVPVPGSESVHMNLYVFDNRTNPLQCGMEIIVEAFDYLP